MTKIHCNKSSVSRAYETHKNICHIVREKLKKDLIHLLPISTKEKLNDIYTKGLHPQSFKSIYSKVGSHNICSTPCGDNKGYRYKASSRRKLILILCFLILSCFSLYICLAFILSFLILAFIGILFYILSL